MAATPDTPAGPSAALTRADERLDFWHARIEERLQVLAAAREPAELYEPVRYILRGQGKRLRPLIVLLTCEALEQDAEKALPAALAVEVFHAFTLVHDDIMDHSATRRGRETAHTRWDESVAMLAGDYLMALSYRLLAQSDAQILSQALDRYHTMVARLCEGQALDKAFETKQDVTLEDYLHMIDCKTGALLKASFQLGALTGGARADAVERLGVVGERIGRAFQIQDDLLDLVADGAKWGKPIGGDLVEGKKTYLLLRALEKASGDERAWFDSIRRHQGLPHVDVAEARQRMQALGILDDARAAVRTLMQEALSLLDDLEVGDAAAPLYRLLHRTSARVR